MIGLTLGLTTSVRWQYLLACLESVDRQRDAIDEIICVEDGLTHPNIERICEDYGVTFIQLPMPKAHRRLCVCHNRLFDECKTEVLVRASQDQVFAPGFFEQARWLALEYGPKTILLPYVEYMEDDAAMGDQATRFFNGEGIATWRAADRPVLVCWPQGLPRVDEDFDTVCSHDGVEWAWRVKQADYTCRMANDLRSRHIGHPAYPNMEQMLAAEALLKAKTNGEAIC